MKVSITWSNGRLKKDCHMVSAFGMFRDAGKESMWDGTTWAQCP